MAEFCYTNPTIVPGEELSRRGFSMYSGSDNIMDEYGVRGNKYSNTSPHHETRSKFWMIYKHALHEVLWTFLREKKAVDIMCLFWNLLVRWFAE